MVNIRKAAMIGCGFVGSSSAFALMQSGIFSEMVMIDVNREKAEGEAMDIAHGLPFARPIRLYAGTYDDIVDAAIIIITAGANQKPDETRLDLIHKNVEIYKTIIRKSQAKLRGHASYRFKSGGYSHLHSVKTVRFPGEQSAWFWNGA